MDLLRTIAVITLIVIVVTLAVPVFVLSALFYGLRALVKPTKRAQ